MKVLSMEMDYLILSSYPECKHDPARGDGSCGDPSYDKARVMKTLEKKISAGNPNMIEKRAMKFLSMEMDYLMLFYLPKRREDLPIPTATYIDPIMLSYIPGREEGDEDPEYGDGVG
jgi:hypothetical protein